MSDEKETNEKPAKEIKYNCVETISNLGDNPKFQKRITIGNWGKGKNKVDIRTWKTFEKDGELKAAKGISLSEEDIEQIINEKLLEKALEALKKSNP